MREEAGPSGGAGSLAGARDATAEDGEPKFQFSLVWLVATLLRHGRLILISALALSSVDTARRLLAKPEYRTQTVFRAQRQEANRLTAALDLAQRLGFGRGAHGTTPLHFKQVLESRSVLDSVGSRSYAIETEDGLDRRYLADLVDIRASDEAIKQRRVRGWLRRAIFVETNLQLGSVSIAVQTRWPHLSQGIAQQLVLEVDRFNVETRQTGSRAERMFIEKQLDSAFVNLRAAERALQEFKDTNRNFGDWSPLTVERARLEEEVRQSRRLYGNLRLMYDEARVAEVRDTPVITVLQRPFLPIRPVSRGLILGASSGFMAGGLAACMAVLFGQYYLSAASATGRRELRMAWDHFAAAIPVLSNLKKK